MAISATQEPQAQGFLSELWNQVTNTQIGQAVGELAKDAADAIDRFIPKQKLPRLKLENHQVQIRVACTMRVQRLDVKGLTEHIKNMNPEELKRAIEEFRPPEVRPNCDCMIALPGYKDTRTAYEKLDHNITAHESVQGIFLDNWAALKESVETAEGLTDEQRAELLTRLDALFATHNVYERYDRDKKVLTKEEAMEILEASTNTAKP